MSRDPIIFSVSVAFSLFLCLVFLCVYQTLLFLFQSIMEQFNPCLRNFVAMGKTYEKALSSEYIDTKLLLFNPMFYLSGICTAHLLGQLQVCKLKSLQGMVSIHRTHAWPC